MPLKSDIEVTDEELFKDLDDDVFQKITENLPPEMKSGRREYMDPISGLPMLQFTIGDFVIYTTALIK